MIERDRRRELELLSRAGEFIPDESGLYLATVTSRLDDVESRRGTSGWQDLVKVAGEISEETVDISGWSIGFDLLAGLLPGLSALDRLSLELPLVRAMTHGACAFSATRELTARAQRITAS